MATITINPNQPRPPVLASDICPPPVWPLPLTDWKSLPVVPEGFPTGPFPAQSMGPISDGTPPVIPPCPGTSMVVPDEPEETAARLTQQRRGFALSADTTQSAIEDKREQPFEVEDRPARETTRSTRHRRETPSE